MKGHRIFAVIRRHLYEARRNFDRISEIIYWPILDVVVWGFLTIYLSKNYSLGQSFINFLMGAAILWGIFYAFQRDLALGFLDELWARNLLNLFATPLKVSEYLAGLITVNFLKMLLGFLAASSLALFFYSFNIFQYALLFLPYFFNILLFALVVGFFTTALIFRYTTKIQMFVWGFAALLQPVSCVFYPLSALPDFLQFIARLLPTTYSFEGMRLALSSGNFSFQYFWWGLVLNIFYLVMAILFFGMIFKVAKRRGLLVKLE